VLKADAGGKKESGSISIRSLFIEKLELLPAVAAIAATAAVTASTTVASAAPAAAASSAAVTSTAVIAGAGFVDDQVAAVVFLAVELRDRVVRGIVGGHLDEAEPARAAGLAIHYDVGGINLAGCCKMFLKVFAGDAKRQISYVKFRAHFPLNLSNHKEKQARGRYRRGFPKGGIL
jgi:hypothetical protein